MNSQELKIWRKIYAFYFIPEERIIYVGQTKQPGNSRWQDHWNAVKCHESQSKFYTFLREHKEEEFKQIILEEGYFTLQEINDLEEFYIKKYDTINNGYNTLQRSRQAIEFVGGREVDYYDNNKNFVCTFETMAEASRVTGVDVANISHCCTYYCDKTAKGWFRYKGDNTPLKDPYRSGIKTKVQQLDPFTLEVIKEYDSLQIAEQTLDITRGYLSQACKGRKYSGKGFRWQYSDPSMRQEYTGSLKGVRCGVAQVDKNTKEVLHFFLSPQDAQDFIGVPNGQEIKRAKNLPLVKSSYGYYWVSSIDYLDLIKEGKIINKNGVKHY